MNSFQVTPRRDLDSPKSSSLNEEFSGTQQSSATTSSGKNKVKVEFFLKGSLNLIPSPSLCVGLRSEKARKSCSPIQSF